MPLRRGCRRAAGCGCLHSLSCGRHCQPDQHLFPEVIGLSGGVANQGENLLKPLRAAVEPMVFGHDFAQKHTRITACTLGYRAGVIGAALLAKSRME
ncbi:ROK family protein [Gemmiger formicilis]|nr:ROK family protein [Gemmiger formicilis]